MTSESLFSGPFFDYLMQQEPLRSAEYFAEGTSAMILPSPSGHPVKRYTATR